MNQHNHTFKETNPFSEGLIPIIAVAVAFIFCFHKTIAGLIHLWLTSAEYSYALAIPFVSAFFIWKSRRKIRPSIVQTDWLGGLSFFLLLIISLYGTLGSSPSAVRPAMPLLIMSITLFCFGRQVFRALFFPFFLLLFMIPLPTLVQTRIGVFLQIISTDLGVFLLRLMGISVFVEGNLIDLGVTQLQVVEACSGLRYLLPLLSLGVIFARVVEKNFWKQLLLALSTVPISIIANSTRIALTGFLVQHYSLVVADRFFHGFSGWLIFVISLCALTGIHFLFAVVWPSKTDAREESERMDKQPLLSTAKTGNRGAIIVVCLSLVLAGWLNSSTGALDPIHLQGGFSGFPLKLENWTGRRESLDYRIVQLSGAEEAFNAAYFSPTGEIVSLYIGYRGSPFTESENFFHSPSVCMPSLGWKTLQSDNHTIEDLPGFGSLTVRKMLIEKMGSRQLVYYWFQTNRRVSADVHINRLHLTLHALTRKNTYDLFLRPMTPLAASENLSAAERRLDRFTRNLMTALKPFLAAAIVSPESAHEPSP